jgi:hypothetical protein
VIGNTAISRIARSSRHSTGSGADRDERIGELRHAREPGREVVRPGGQAQTFAGEDHMGPDGEQRFGLHRRPVGVDHDRQAGAAGGAADRRHESGEAVVHQHRVDACYEAVGVRGHRGVEAMVPIGGDGAVAARIDEDRRDRGAGTGNAYASAAVDAFLREALDQPVADGVADRVLARRPAERRREGDLAAEAHDGDGGVGGAAADELARFHLVVRQREFANAEHLVENRYSRAEDVRHVRRGSGRLRPMPG